MKLSVVIPCYRSRDTLRPLVTRLHDVLATAVEDYEVILVVDGSPDDTYAVAHTLELESTHVRAVLLRRNYGQHNALLAGILRAHHEVIVTMDDDLQHRPEELPVLLEPLSNPLVDLVYGVPTVEEHGFARSIASRSVKAALAASGVDNARDVSALRAFRTDLREGFSNVNDPFASVDVLLSWTTTGVRRQSVQMDRREVGRSAYSLRKLVRHAVTMVTGYSALPLKLVTYLGALCGLLGLLLLGFVLYRFASGGTTVAGFTTLASMIALFSGAQMVSIGILGEYVGRMHFRGMQRPTFVVRVDGADDGPRAGVPSELPAGRAQHQSPDNVAAAMKKA
ncbi:glycosyltransferase family 2 protein [Angustibacter sp. McL0619]|uniref:glycosyltransferase family 2 protein n=1 Tax=Angustibacter sp. McL0619 TaxID=3415676 RepID=UPI003CEAACB1